MTQGLRRLRDQLEAHKIVVNGKDGRLYTLRPIHSSDGPMERYCSVCTGAHEHPSLTRPDHAKPGNGLLLFFRVDNFGVALPRARAFVSRLEEEPHMNPNTGTAEFSLRDPDGYYVTISALNAA